MKAIKITLGCLLLSYSANIFAWGQTGHRITGQIAEEYLSESAKQQIKLIFPASSLAEISTKADEERSNPDEFWQKQAGPWHYVTVPHGKTYQQVGAPEEGDAVTALKRFAKILKDDASSMEEKQLALHFTVHIIGDLHQPLHAGNGTDRGGNDRKVRFFWQDSNLHRVWDSGLIDSQQLSYTEWSDWLSQKITSQQVQQWQQASVQQWITESTQLRDKLYPESDDISWHYQYQHLPTIKVRLQQAGVRMATYLNQLFEK